MKRGRDDGGIREEAILVVEGKSFHVEEGLGSEWKGCRGPVALLVAPVGEGNRMSAVE